MPKSTTRKPVMILSLRKLTLYWLSALIGSLLLSACASSPTDKKIEITYNINAAQDINPDIKGAPSSVVVQIYQLNNSNNFQDALYDDLFNDNVSTLGNQVIGINKYLIDPGSAQQIDTEISANTKFIGVAVGYRKIDLITWKVVKPVAEDSIFDSINLFTNKNVVISIESKNVRVSTD